MSITQHPLYTIRALPFVFLLLLLGLSNLLSPLDNLFWDTFTQFSPRQTTSHIVIVAIDDASLQQYGRISAWNRDNYTRAIQNLQQAGAKVVGVDILLPETTPQDTALAAVLNQPHVVLADAWQFGTKVPHNPKLTSAQYGAILIDTSPNSIARSFQTAYRFNTVLHTSFSARIAQKAGATFTPREQPEYIRYAGIPGESFEYLSFADVLSGNFRYASVQNKVVLIGVMAGGLDRDQFLSPYKQNLRPIPMAGIEVQANAIHTLLSGRFYTVPNAVVSVLAALLCALLVGLALPVWLFLLLAVLCVALSYALHLASIVAGLSAVVLGIVLALALRTNFSLQDVQYRINERLQELSGQTTQGRVNAVKRLELIKNIEDTLDTERKRFQTLLDNMDAPVFLSDNAGNILAQNLSARHVFGEQVTVLGALQSLELPEIEHNIHNVLEKQKPYEELTEKGLLSLRALPKSSGMMGILTPSNQFAHLMEQQDQMAAGIVHDFRNPLTNIMGFTQLLQSSARAEDAQVYDIILSESRRMSELIDDFLTVSRSKTAIEPREYNLATLIRRAATVAAPMYNSKKMRLSLNLPRNMYLWLDEKAMTRVILNLLSNAAKYSPEGSEVTVTLENTAQEALIRVQDHGVGLSEEDQHRLFGRFFRSNNPAIKQVKGTGLGLYTVKELVKAHHGEIGVQSVLGHGTTFSIHLPVSGLKPKNSSENLQPSEGML